MIAVPNCLSNEGIVTKRPALILCMAVILPACSAASGASIQQRARQTHDASKGQESLCPHNLRPLPPDAVAPAARAGLAAASRIWGEAAHRAIITDAARAEFDSDRGPEAKRQCGKGWGRTVVVYLFFPKLRFSSSLSQGVLFVARFPAGWRVWERVH
jgi:hypothetical protein